MGVLVCIPDWDVDKQVMGRVSERLSTHADVRRQSVLDHHENHCRLESKDWFMNVSRTKRAKR